MLPDRTDDGSLLRLGRTASISLLVIGLFLLVDLFLDLRGGEGGLHVGIELVFALFTLTVFLLLQREVRLEKTHSRELESDLTKARHDVDHWRSEAQEALRGLSEAIDHQFQRWTLSPAERDVGFLILKGLSHKEVALVRDTSERTVRQQAREIYRKAGLGGRAELSAWFLEDLMQPVPAAPDVEPADGSTRDA